MVKRRRKKEKKREVETVASVTFMGLVIFNCLCSTCRGEGVNNALDRIHCVVGGLVHILGTELDADGAGVSVGGMDGVSQVDQEGRAHPAESCHNILVRQLLTVEEVSGRDTDGVCGPEA